MSTKHTQTPWMQKEAEENKNKFYIKSENGIVTLAAVLCKEDAEFIVKAVNSHEGLLEACKYALEYLEANPDEYSRPRASRLKKAIQQAEVK